jgi:hypothetical protein
MGTCPLIVPRGEVDGGTHGDSVASISTGLPTKDEFYDCANVGVVQTKSPPDKGKSCAVGSVEV